MMTPKEKAKQLVDRHFKNEYLFHDLSYYQAVICALIAVDEILEEIYYTESTTYGCTFWQEVKQEIEKL